MKKQNNFLGKVQFRIFGGCTFFMIIFSKNYDVFCEKNCLNLQQLKC